MKPAAFALAIVGASTLVAAFASDPGQDSVIPDPFPAGYLQRQIDEANEGSVILVPSGIHRGNLYITKPIHLSGQPGARIVGEGSGSTIHIVAPGVTVENLGISQSGTNLATDDSGIRVEADEAVIRGNTLKNVLHGIYLKASASTRIENNRIEGWSLNTESSDIDNSAMCSTGSDRRGNGIHAWNSKEVRIVGNAVSGMRDGIYLSFTKNSLIEGNEAWGCRYGLHYMYSDHNVIRRNTFSKNAAGAALMFSKHLAVEDNHFTDHDGSRAGGVVLHSVDYSHITGNLSRRNRTALYLQNCNENTFHRNRMAQNYIGLRLTGSSTSNHFKENAFAHNLHNVNISGSTRRNHWDDGKRGNYWDTSSSIDLNGDGAGEWPHHEVDLLGPYRQEFPLIGLLSGGPFIRAIQFAIQRSPAPGLFSITDKHPLLPSPEKHDLRPPNL